MMCVHTNRHDVCPHVLLADETLRYSSSKVQMSRKAVEAPFQTFENSAKVVEVGRELVKVTIGWIL